LRTRVLRQVHALPRGHVLAPADHGAARVRAGHAGRHRQAPGHLRQHLRPLVLRARRRRRQPDHLWGEVLPRGVRGRHAHLRCRAVPAGCLDLVREGDRVRMTVTASSAATSSAPALVDMVNLTIDGVPVSVPKGTLVIRAAEQIGVEIPRFCDHPLLEPVGACRQCLVEVATPGPDGSLRPFPKPQTSCTTTVSEGMAVQSQCSSPVADKAQQAQMEFLLLNHPLDCPVCDKGGECPLQNQAMSTGRTESRFRDVKRTYPKPVNISSQVLLDRERCVLCARCTRFSDQIAGDPFIALVERGALQQVGIYEKEPFESYFSGNTVQICPVGALTGAAYRFRARPYDLISTPSVCEHCASGCATRTDHRRGTVLRRLADNDPAV